MEVEGPPGLGKRKDRDGNGDFVDIEDEDDEQVPTEMAGPPHPKLKRFPLKRRDGSSRSRIF